MKEKYKISVIVPVYNAEKYLERCIHSVINQTYDNWELLLVDDGSQDQSGNICDKYSKTDPRIIVIHQSNEGVSVARNNGIDAATGEYILFLDSDDWIENNTLYYISRKIDDTIDFFLFDYYEVTENGKYEKHFFKNRTEIVFNEDAQYSKELLLTAFAGHYTEYAVNRPLIGGICGKVYQRSIIVKNAIKFTKGVSICEDMLFNICYCSLCEKIVYESIALYNYYINENSASHLMTAEKWDTFISGMYNANLAVMIAKDQLLSENGQLISEYFQLYLIQIVLWRLPKIKKKSSIHMGQQFCIDHAKLIDSPPHLTIMEKCILRCCKKKKIHVLRICFGIINYAQEIAMKGTIYNG